MTHLHLNVEFEEGLTLFKAIAQVSRLASPHVILWYVGTHGLKKKAVDFYRKSVIAPLLNSYKDITFWLIDLTAWGALKNPKVTITKYSSHAETLDKSITATVKCIKSADIFKKMQSITQPSIINYFHRALARPFIWQASANARNNSLILKDIFPDGCPLLSPFYNYQTSKSYSMLQYLEGCLIVHEIICKILDEKNNKDVEIIFMLPNDEIKYYRDENFSFKSDLEFLTKSLQGELVDRLNITVKFFSFKYGESISKRPYNVPGKGFKKNELTADHIIGISHPGEDYVFSTF